MKRIDFRKFVFCVVILLSGITVAQQTPAQVAAEKRLRILAGTAGGLFEPLAKAYTEMINKSIPSTVATSENTKGSVFNVHTLAAKQADIIFGQADVIWEGYKGFGEFRDKVPLRALVVLYPNSLQLVATRKSGIRTAKDLTGMRVSTNSPGTGGEIWALRLLATNNIDPDKDLQRHKLNLVDSVAAMKSGKIDAFFFSGGAPAKAIAELANDPPPGGLQFIDTAHAVTPMLRKYGPVYADGVIPANTYAGQTGLVKVADVWNLVVVRADMDEKLAYDLVKALFDNKGSFEDRPDLAAVSKILRQVSLKNQALNSPVPFHPGAAKYLKENGVRLFNSR